MKPRLRPMYDWIFWLQLAVVCACAIAAGIIVGNVLLKGLLP